LRDEGNGEISLSYKKRLGSANRAGTINDEGMQEIEIRVNDFDKTSDFFQVIGLVIKHSAEKKRIR
jgi:adenylate cyclase class IV